MCSCVHGRGRERILLKGASGNKNAVERTRAAAQQKQKEKLALCAGRCEGAESKVHYCGGRRWRHVVLLCPGVGIKGCRRCASLKTGSAWLIIVRPCIEPSHSPKTCVCWRERKSTPRVSAHQANFSKSCKIILNYC